MNPTTNPVEENDLQKAIAGMAGASTVAPGGGIGAADAPMGAAFMDEADSPAAPVASDPEPRSSMTPPAVPSIPGFPSPSSPVSPAPAPAALASSGDLDQVKMSALNDLKPIIDRVNIDPGDKFKIYREILEDMPDKTVIEPAYNAAKQIADESEKAEALLFVVQKIDELK
jgi:hypothetical protein